MTAEQALGVLGGSGGIGLRTAGLRASQSIPPSQCTCTDWATGTLEELGQGLSINVFIESLLRARYSSKGVDTLVSKTHRGYVVMGRVSLWGEKKSNQINVRWRQMLRGQGEG